MQPRNLIFVNGVDAMPVTRSPAHGPACPYRAISAFTLIELLVVISIIALLIGILLPVLGTAREAARSAGCLAHLRGAGQGLAVYYTENRGWLPGPNTSGIELGDNTFNPGDADAPTKPLQNFDWVSPTLGDSLALPADPSDRLVAIFEEEFRCPSNDEFFDGEFNSSAISPPNIDNLPVSSYSMITNFVVFGLARTVTPDQVKQESRVGARVRTPVDYGPNIEALGQQSNKIAALDGARFVDRSSGEITFNGFARQEEGGNFALHGPVVSQIESGNSGIGSPYLWETESDKTNSRRFGYRHSNDTLNAVHFDGHGENFTVERSKRVEWYWPSGSTINNMSLVEDPTVSAGQTVP